jgi:soluble P-type ATPase
MPHNYGLPAYKILGNFALTLVSELESKRLDKAIIERCKEVIRMIADYEPGTMVNLGKLNDGISKRGIKAMKEKEIYQKAIKKFGQQLQITKAIEEMSELQKELCKLLIGNGIREHIAEEMADVGIMLKQLEIIFANKELVADYKIKKFKRLKKLLEVYDDKPKSA